MQPATCHPKSEIGGFPILAFFLLFLGCIVGAWAWFNLPWFKVEGSALNVPDVGVHLQPRGTVPGYRFISEPLSDQVCETLGTTNIINGTFAPIGLSGIGDRGTGSGTEQQTAARSTLHPHRTTDHGPLTSDEISESAFRNPQSALSSVRVFLASWRTEAGRKTVSTLHTPDVCWRLAGWSTLSLGQPNQAWLSIDGRRLPMQSRLFRSPGGADREFVMWCTLVDGRPLETAGWAPASGRATSGPGRRGSTRADAEVRDAVEVAPPVAPGPRSPAQFVAFQEAADNARRGESFPLKQDLASRRIIAQDFWELVKRRTTLNGNRQFLRVSVSTATDWQTALSQINSFVPGWLKL